VTLFERNDYPGGHTHTIVLDSGPDAGTAVDTGFIVLNEPNYPLFNRLLDTLGVPRQDSDMTFSFHCERTGFHYAGTGWNGVFSDRWNLLRPRFHKTLLDILRFSRRAKRDLETIDDEETLGSYLDRIGLGPGLREYYLLPMSAAIWSAPQQEILRFPAKAFVRFFHNHGLLDLDQPIWRTVRGGSHTYVKALLEAFRGTVMLRATVTSVQRTETGVVVAAGDRREEFDRVVIATHADEALGMLADPSPEERRLLGAWQYSHNRVLLHTDTSVLPPRRRAWASWNYTREAGDDRTRPASVTYYMNRLQRLQTEQHYCVTLNRRGKIDESAILREMEYTHPIFSLESMRTQRELASLNGARNTYFAGSYFYYGFHEDAVRSAVDVARDLGEEL
jgi:predicted NAD/FAD-binding protein